MLQELAEVKASFHQHRLSFNMTLMICALLFYAMLIHLGNNCEDFIGFPLLLERKKKTNTNKQKKPVLSDCTLAGVADLSRTWPSQFLIVLLYDISVVQ